MKVITVGNLATNQDAVSIENEILVELHANDILLDFRHTTVVFPKAAVALAGLIRQFEGRIACQFNEEGSFIEKTKICNPIRYGRPTSIKDKLFLIRQSNGIVSSFCNAVIGEIRSRVEVKKGILEALDWMLAELLDNSHRHSGVDDALFMYQVHPKTKTIALALYDAGMGIRQSLLRANAIAESVSDIEAIRLALKKGVTKGDGAGFGLFGTFNLIRENGGQISVFSNGYGISFDELGQEYLGHPPLGTHPDFTPGTLLEFQLKYSKSVNIVKALEGHKPLNKFIDDLSEYPDQVIYKITDRPYGHSTRPAGERVRKELINLSEEVEKKIVIDFVGINVISSSFADEVIAKLVSKYGVVGFSQHFALRGMSEVVADLIETAIHDRLSKR